MSIIIPQEQLQPDTLQALIEDSARAMEPVTKG